MARLIDADAFEAHMLHEWVKTEISNGDWVHFREMINAEPTIEERKTGKWILDNLNNGYGMVYHCTECNWLTTNPQYAYCPNCGARMEEE